MMIYADHAATTKLDRAAFEAMKPFLTDEFGNASQLYSFAREPKKAIKEARGIIASCIGATPDEIFFTSGGTESDNWALKGSTLFRYDEKAIITSMIEHHAVLHSCAFLERLKHPVAYLPVDRHGSIQMLFKRSVIYRSMLRIFRLICFLHRHISLMGRKA